MAMRILAVDDEPAVAQSVSFVLNQPGRKVASVCSAQEALSRIAQEQFDLIITDNNMPGLNGLELVRRLRALNFSGKIVVLSAHLSHDNVQAYSELDVDDMLEKPFNVQELRSAIDKVASAA